MSMSKSLETPEWQELWMLLERGTEEGNTMLMFIEKRLQIEEEYSKSLVKLCKSTPTTSGTAVGDAFDSFLQCSTQQATLLGATVVAAQDEVVEALKTFMKGMKSEAKEKQAEGIKVFKERKDCFELLKKSKSIYEAICKEGDPDPSKVAVIEEDYKKQIAFSNRYNEIYHNEKQPKVLADLIKLEMFRIQKFKTHMSKLLQMYEQTGEKVNSSTQRPHQMIEAIDPKAEVQSLNVVGKRCNIPAPDFVFEPIEINDRGKKASWRKTMGSESPASSSSSSPSSPALVHSSSGGGGGGGGHSRQPSISSAPVIMKVSIPTTVFGVNLEDQMERQKSRFPSLDVPWILLTLTNVLRQLDVFNTQGVFRVPGVSSEIQSLKKQLDEGNDQIQCNNVHTPASLLKLWLRELPASLFPEAMYDICLDSTTPDAAIKSFQILPPINQRVVVFVLQFLTELAQPEYVVNTLMSKDNLAMVFAPSFLRSSNLTASDMMINVEREMSYVKLLLEVVDKLAAIAKPSAAAASSSTTTTPSSSSPSSNWQQTKTPDGKVYYYNIVTRETSWTKPETLSAAPAHVPVPAASASASAPAPAPAPTPTPPTQTPQLTPSASPSIAPSKPIPRPAVSPASTTPSPSPVSSPAINSPALAPVKQFKLPAVETIQSPELSADEAAPRPAPINAVLAKVNPKSRASMVTPATAPPAPLAIRFKSQMFGGIPPPPTEWIEYATDDGRKYYHNPTTNQTSWTKPEAQPPAPAAPPPAAPSPVMMKLPSLPPGFVLKKPTSNNQ